MPGERVGFVLILLVAFGVLGRGIVLLVGHLVCP